MKKLILLLSISIILCGCSIGEYKLSYNKNDQCDKLEQIYDGGNYKVFTYCLSDLKYGKKELKEILNNKKLSIEEIVSKMEINHNYDMDDGGTKLYEASDYRIVSCHRIVSMNNNDLKYNSNYVIGSKDMLYQEMFCK